MFFISVASKGFRFCVSGLESTLGGIFISVDSKGTYIAQELCGNGLLLHNGMVRRKAARFASTELAPHHPPINLHEYQKKRLTKRAFRN